MSIHHHILRISVLVVTVVCLSTFADWVEVNGPTDFGAGVHYAGGKLFAVTMTDGIYTSGDNGSTWKTLTVDNGSAGSYVNAFIVSDNTLFVSVGDSVCRSLDNGASWTRFATPLEYVRCMTAANGLLVVGTQDGVYTAPLNGAVWTKKTTGITDSNIAIVAVSGGTLFAGAGRGSLYRSENSGTSWTEVTLGTSKATVHCIEAGGTTLFAGTDSSLFRSEDDGKTWAAAASGLLPRVSVNAFLALGNFYLAGTDSGVFRSADNGASWTPANPDTSWDRINAFEMAGTKLYATNIDEGVLVSHDSGTTWNICNSGVAHQWVPTMLAYGTTVFAGMTLGVYRSTDNGVSWKMVDDGLYSYVNNFCMLDSNVYTVTDTGTLHQFSNTTLTWTEKAKCPWKCRTVALVAKGTKIFAATDSSGLFSYTPGASKWDSVTATLPANVEYTSLAVTGTALFAGTYSKGVYRSTDNGATWKNVTPGIEYLTTISLSANDHSVLIGTYDGGYLSKDNGETWVDCKKGVEQQTVYESIFRGENIFVATREGIYMSADTGKSWDRMDPSLFGYNNTVYSLALTTSSLFVGCSSELYKRDLAEMLSQPTAVLPLQSRQKLGLNLGHLSGNGAGMHLSFTLPKAGVVTLDIYNIAGRQVASVVNEHRAAGNHTVCLNTGKLASGRYTLRLTSCKECAVKGFSVF